jgi:hypothetical protein
MHVLHEWTSLQPPTALHTDTTHWRQAGTLGQALQRGLLHTRRLRRPRLLPLLAIALDVAEALVYLHDPVIGLVRHAGCGVALSAMPPVMLRLCWGFLRPADFSRLCHAPGWQAQLVVVCACGCVSTLPNLFQQILSTEPSTRASVIATSDVHRRTPATVEPAL